MAIGRLRGARTRLFACVAGSALAALLSACGQDNRYVAPPPPQVRVALPLQHEVTRYLEATGYTAAVNSASLVARVQGFLTGIHYQDGDLVKEGTLLFTIERAPYQLKLEQAQAAEDGAGAALKQAEAEFDRQTELASRAVASKAALDNATANRDSAAAKLKQAQVDTAQVALNLSYTEVKAPFEGNVTARLVSKGDLVGANGPTQLATIVEPDPIYVNFNVGEQDVLRIREEIRRLGLTDQQLRQTPVEVGLQDDPGYPHVGTLDYAAPSLNQATGTLAVRAIVKNADRVLLPGYFVRVRIAEEQNKDLLVPDAALGSDQGGRYLLVVNKDNVVEQRPVAIGPLVGELRAIDRGLKADDRVVVAGVLRAVPGQKVDPQLETIAAPAAPPPASPGPPPAGAGAK
jgi:RND family efflux transporter MFP subunit